MTKHADHQQIADLLRRNSPHWMIIDQASDRSRIGGRVSAWNSIDRQPRAFAQGGFEFRTRKEHDGPRGLLLEGRYIGSGPAPY